VSDAAKAPTHPRRGRAMQPNQAGQPAQEEPSPGPPDLLPLPNPAGWASPQGYSNAVAGSGLLVFVAGQVGWDPATGQFASDDLVAQVAQALANVVTVLRTAGAEPRHVARLTWYVTDRAAYLAARRAIGAAYRAVMGRHYPAMTLVVVKSLLEERAKVEIEATAVLPDPAAPAAAQGRPTRSKTKTKRAANEGAEG
jgi:enamine deaminase RidA (YjgF/YER057c/UK114 family)